MLSLVNKPLGIALLGINKWERSRLELFIDQHWSSNCHLVAEEYADLCILDLDSLEGKKILEQQRDSHPRRPLIVLSIHNTEISDALLLRKPLNSNLLKSTIDDHIAALFAQPPVDNPPPAPIAGPVTENPIPPARAVSRNLTNHRRSGLPSTATQARIIRGSCGPYGFIELDDDPGNENLYYDPNGYLQQVLQRAIERSRRDALPLSVNLPGEKYIALFPETNTALTNLSDSKLRSRCLLPINVHHVKIDHPNKREINHILANAEMPMDIDSLLWKITLWSARGRLPAGTDIKNPIALRQWPNLTRLVAIPQFLRIAALWVKMPLPLGKTAEHLDIDVRYVCAFFSACYALNLTQSLSAADGKVVSTFDQVRSSAPKRLLRRILRHLRLGVTNH